MSIRVGVTYREMGVDIRIEVPYGAQRRQPSSLDTIVNHRSPTLETSECLLLTV